MDSKSQILSIPTHLPMALDFVAGCAGGAGGLVVGYPFDTIKVHLQAQDVNNQQYRGNLHCMKTIIAKEGVMGLFRGMSSPLYSIAAINAIVFGVYGNMQRNLEDPDSVWSHFLCGGVAGLSQSIVCSPVELVKTRLQLQDSLPSKVRHKSSFACLLYIFQTEGIRGVFRGLTMTTIRDVPGFAIYFASYEYLMQQVGEPSAITTLLAGGTAGSISWFINVPTDVVKSLLQADGMTDTIKYNGILDCIRKSYASGGIPFFFRGLSATVLRSFPSNAVCFYIVSAIMKLGS